MSALISKHVPLLEDPEYDNEGQEHEGYDGHPRPCGVTDKPSELDVHSEEACNECRRHEHQRDQGEDLHDLVLVEIDDGDNRILQILKSFKTEVSVIDKRRDILQKDIKLAVQSLRKFITLED